MPQRVPQLFNLRSDPLEKGNHSIFYQKWMADRMFTLVPAQAIVAEFLKTFEEFSAAAETFELSASTTRWRKRVRLDLSSQGRQAAGRSRRSARSPCPFRQGGGLPGPAFF